MPPAAYAVTFPAALLLTLGALLTYIASRALAEPIGTRLTPVRAALGHWLVIAVVAVGAMLAGRTDLALGVVFASTIATLSLALGLLLALSKRDGAASPPSDQPVSVGMGAAAWRLLVPAALVTFLGGFAGRLDWIHAGVLLLIGLMAASLWRGSARHDVSVDQTPPTAAPKIGAALQIVLAVPLALLGAVLVLRGVGTIGQIWGVPPTRIATALLGPILVMPLIASGTHPTGTSRGDATARCAAVALLNLCLLLPLLIAVDAARGGVLMRTDVGAQWLQRGSDWINPPPQLTLLATPGPTTAPTSEPATPPAPPPEPGIALPLVIWRVDNPCLLILALLLLPLSLGRWSLSLVESELLALFYFLYVLAASQVGGL